MIQRQQKERNNRESVGTEPEINGLIVESNEDAQHKFLQELILLPKNCNALKQFYYEY